MKWADIITEAQTSRWETFMVYGSFDEPTTGKNFIFVRMPAGRAPWQRKIVPAITRLVRPWFSEADRSHDKTAKQLGRERRCFWQVDGDPDPEHSWWYTIKQPVARYEWNGEELVPATLS